MKQFVRSLTSSGLMSTEEVTAFVENLPADRQPLEGRDLARELCRENRLTKYQARAVYQGKIRGLVLGKYVVLDKVGEGGMACGQNIAST